MQPEPPPAHQAARRVLLIVYAAGIATATFLGLAARADRTVLGWLRSVDSWTGGVWTGMWDWL